MGIIDIVLILGVGLFALTMLKGTDSSTPTTTAPATPVTTGTCGKTIYPATGKSMVAKNSGKTSRHYQSGGTSATTEWNVAGCPFEDYEMTGYVTFNADECSWKMLGNGHSDGKGAWHNFNLRIDGKTGLGYEHPHPKTTKLYNGGSVGSVKGKKVGVKAVIWRIPSGHHVEGYVDIGTGWKKMVAGDNPGGKFTKDPNQQVQFRIDDKATFHCAIVQEIRPPTTATAAFALAGGGDGGNNMLYDVETVEDCGD
jgi:hypothetical protein